MKRQDNFNKEKDNFATYFESTDKSYVEFTHIIIRRIVKNIDYVAEFNFSFNGRKPVIETIIHGDSPLSCIKMVEKYLNTKIDSSEYSFHG